MADTPEDKPEEIEARMSFGLKRALHMPPKPHSAKAPKGGLKKPR